MKNKPSFLMTLFKAFLSFFNIRLPSIFARKRCYVRDDPLAMVRKLSRIHRRQEKHRKALLPRQILIKRVKTKKSLI